MAQATYDTFNSNKLSKFVGSSKYSRKNLFSQVGLVKANPFKYNVVKYIYATSSVYVPGAFILKPLSEKAWCKESNWIGYVAVATDEGRLALGRRDILVAWRGTIQPIEWVKDLEYPLVSASKIVGRGGGGDVHQGFLSIYMSENQKSRFNKTSARDQVLSEVKRLVEHYKDEEISITSTGHSMGAALSTLSATDIACNGHNKLDNNSNKTCPVTAFNFASPLVGDSNFRDTLKSTNDLHILSILNVPDIIPHLPAMIGYTSVGIELPIDSRKYRFLKFPGDPDSWHNLEGSYLHSLAIENGSEVKRDIALVNKSCGALKEKYSIPVFWWCERNKGMVQMNNGSWILYDHEKDDNDP
ncbi:Phospholipase A1-IIgamma [Sesamum alatum]|uniref:Phospholipase A1 n=1 Tax=Sesamum alatum TaxID=300844 RepID=A0AAE1YWE7_9LAMI|nr:Phospholipase A1-IIgamma [Sesamum alatum]